MLTYVATIGIIFALLSGLIAVQRAYRSFARRHPDLGPYREEGAGCGTCGGGGDRCTKSSAERECGGRGEVFQEAIRR